MTATRDERGPMTGVELIAAERERQIAAEGWTPEHDEGELAWIGQLVRRAADEWTAP